MTRRLLISASILALTAGCSSSSSNPVTAEDSGTTGGGDSSTAQDSGVASDDGGGSTDTGTTGNTDTGVTPAGDSGTGDAGTCTASSTVGTLPGYTSVTKQSVCSAADVQAAVTACFGGGSATACQTWQAANAACAACAVPPNGADGGDPTANSAIICVDAVQECFVNTAGCIQIKDGNDTCASALQELNFCEDTACDSPTCVAALAANDPNMTFSNCTQSADNLACSSQLSAANTGCTGNDIADGGSLQYCEAATVADVSRVIYEICGNGQ
jgi:hypothetical protein